jgi:hypothetical protein
MKEREGRATRDATKAPEMSEPSSPNVEFEHYVEK